MSAKKDDKKITVQGTKLLRLSRFSVLPFKLPREDVNILKAGGSVKLPAGFVKNHREYFIEGAENGNR